MAHRSRPCALCRQNVGTGCPENVHELMNSGQRRLGRELLQNLISCTIRRRLEGSLAIEMNDMKELLRRARQTWGFDGVLATVTLFRSPIEVRQFVPVASCI